MQLLTNTLQMQNCMLCTTTCGDNTCRVEAKQKTKMMLSLVFNNP